MKKTYIYPEMETIEIKARATLLDASSRGVYNDDPVNDVGDLLGREDNSDF